MVLLLGKRPSADQVDDGDKWFGDNGNFNQNEKSDVSAPTRIEISEPMPAAMFKSCSDL